MGVGKLPLGHKKAAPEGGFCARLQERGDQGSLNSTLTLSVTAAAST